MHANSFRVPAKALIVPDNPSAFPPSLAVNPEIIDIKLGSSVATALSE
jgi:hypothetical protein